jgi:hypothetical protein
VWTTVHRFRNPTLVGGSLFSFRDFTKAEVESHGLPKWEAFQWRPSHGGPAGFCGRLDRLNADLGHSCKVRVHFVWSPDGAGPEWGELLEEHWKCGKKNELTVVVSESGGRVEWCRVFGWSRSDGIKASMREMVAGSERFNGDAVLDFLRHEIPTAWQVADFKEYDHIHVRVPVWLTLLLLGTLGGGTAFVILRFGQDAVVWW